MLPKILIFLLFLLFITGCQQVITCNPPYILVGTGCCLDQDNNSICDLDEPKEETTPVIIINTIENTTTIPENNTIPTEPETTLSVEQALKRVVVVEVLQDDKVILSGSGFFIDPEGYILTNRHVVDSWNVEGIAEMRVLFRIKTNNNKYYNVSVMDWSWDYDIALLKVKGDYTFPYLEFSPSADIELGSNIYALGSPEGLYFSSTKGSISAKNRKGLTNQNITEYIQIDAPLNAGNSGGPIIHNGKVIGLATFGYAAWYAEGLYFALESEAVKHLYDIMKQVKSPVPDASLPVCKMGMQESVQPASTYGYENFGDVIEGSKPTSLNIFYNEQQNKISFFRINLDIHNKDNKEHELCFRAKVISEGEVLLNKAIGEELLIQPNQVMADHEIELGVSTEYSSAWQYYEITIYDCKTRVNYYTFHRKDYFSSNQRSGNIVVFEKC